VVAEHSGFHDGKIWLHNKDRVKVVAPPPIIVADEDLGGRLCLGSASSSRAKSSKSQLVEVYTNLGCESVDAGTDRSTTHARVNDTSMIPRLQRAAEDEAGMHDPRPFVEEL